MTCVVQNWPSGSIGFPPVSINRSFWRECENLVSQTQDKAVSLPCYCSLALSLSLALSCSLSLSLALALALSLSLVTKGQAEVRVGRSLPMGDKCHLSVPACLPPSLPPSDFSLPPSPPPAVLLGSDIGRAASSRMVLRAGFTPAE